MFKMKKKPKKKKKNVDDSDSDCDKEDPISVDKEGYQTYQVPGVVCSNFDDTVMHFIHARGLNPGNVRVLVGLDDGQKFNKIGFVLKDVEREDQEGRVRRDQ